MLIAFTREYERAGDGLPTLPTLPVWADFLRVISEAGVETRDIPRLARISRRAVPPLLLGVGRDDRRVLSENPSGKRGAGIARLTATGRMASDAARAAVHDVESRWTKQFGKARITAARTALEGVVQQFDLEFPHYVIGYGPADWSITGGPYVAAKPGPPRIPGHGADWIPVVRQQDVDTVSDLPLFALVSQALVAFAIDYESRAGSLWIAAVILSVIDDTGVGIDDVPDAAGVTGTGRSGLERHRVVTVTSGRKKAGTKRVHLTALGKRLRDAYEPLVGQVEQEWQGRYGTTAVGDLRSSLVALARDLDPTLPHYPTMRWIGGLQEISG